MNFLLLNHAIALLLTAATSFLVGAFVLFKSGLEKTKLANSLWYLSVSGWSFFLGIFILQDEPSKLILSLMWSFVLFIPISTAHFVNYFLNIKRKDWFIRIGYILAFIYVAISFSGKMGATVINLGYLKNFPKVNIYVYIQAVIFFIYFFYQIFLLYKAYRSSTGTRHNQIAYVFWASLFGYIGGGSNYALAFNIYLPIFNPFATYFLLLYTILIPLAILKYKLMDISVVIKKTLLYSSGIAMISGLMVSISFLSSWFTDNIPGFDFWIIPLITGTVAFSVGRIFWNKSKEVEKLKYEFITIAAHKLRTPLTKVKWALEVLSDETKNSENKLIREAIKANEQTIELTDELLALSRVESEHHKYRFEKANLERVARGVVNDFQLQMKEKKIKFTYNVEKNLPKVNIDKLRISTVVQMLLENAIAYTKDEIKISIDVYKNNVIFHIEDNGIGIPKEDQPYIFSKFFRTHEAYLTETEGSGIGLFLSKSIIDKHGGKMGVRSGGEGKGSIFWFGLPIAE